MTVESLFLESLHFASKLNLVISFMSFNECNRHNKMALVSSCDENCEP